MDTERLNFSSDFTYMRRFKEFEFSITTDAGVEGTASGRHDLGYIPYYQVWVDVQGVLIPAAATGVVRTPDLLTTDVTVRVDERNISISQTQNTGPDKTYVYYIKIYEDTFA